MKTKLLAAVASIAFIAAGVAAQAQENPKHDQHPAATRAEPRAGAAEAQHRDEMKGAQMERRDETKGAETQRRDETKGAQMERRDESKGAQTQRRDETKGAQMERRDESKGAQTQRRDEMKGAAERSRAAQAEQQKSGEMNKRNEAMKPGANGQENRRTAEPAKGERAPAERTGENQADHNGQRTAEHPAGAPRVTGDIKMSTEHATRVSEFLRRGARPENVNIAIRVGARVPENVVVEPLPADVIALVPEYRGYDYFIDSNDEIVFVAPETHEVVGMIDYEGRAASEDMQRVAGARPCPTEQ